MIITTICTCFLQSYLNTIEHYFRLKTLLSNWWATLGAQPISWVVIFSWIFLLSGAKTNKYNVSAQCMQCQLTITCHKSNTSARLPLLHAFTFDVILLAIPYRANFVSKINELCQSKDVHCIKPNTKTLYVPFIKRSNFLFHWKQK